jgi:hypothetical protein
MGEERQAVIQLGQVGLAGQAGTTRRRMRVHPVIRPSSLGVSAG